MAKLASRLPENVPGDFYVDSTCIDCDACRQIAPETFTEDHDTSIVHHQPESAGEIKRALMALVACPTASIGTVEPHDAHIGIDAFPKNIAENVYFCGFTAESSFGAWSYLIARPEAEGGNVLIDSPRFATQLVRKIEAARQIKHRNNLISPPRKSDEHISAFSSIQYSAQGARACFRGCRNVFVHDPAEPIRSHNPEVSPSNASALPTNTNRRSEKPSAFRDWATRLDDRQ